jgi:hypothetical protein
VVTTTVSAGGVDAENDIAYRDRLAAELTLSSPRPILPDDFAILARNVTGVTRALAVNGSIPARTNPAGRHHGIPHGWHIHPHLLGQTTRDRLQRHGGDGADAPRACRTSVTMTSSSPAATAGHARWSSSALWRDERRGDDAHGFPDGRLEPGGCGDDADGRRAGSYVTVVPIDSTGLPVSAATRAAVVTYLDGLREVSFVVKATTPTYTTINIAYTIKVAAGYDATAVKNACDAALTAFLSPATWGGGDESPPVWRSGEVTVRLGEVYGALYAVAGVQYVSSLTINSGTSDVTLTGVAPLPSVGTITGTTT